jgi:hypothetical protein
MIHVVYFLETNNYLLGCSEFAALQCTLYTLPYLLGFVEICIPPCSSCLEAALKKFLSSVYYVRLSVTGIVTGGDILTEHLLM